jgi:hypothetical protein
MEPWKLTASEALAQIQADELSVREYAKSLLERIDERDKDVQAWAYLDEQTIMQQAKSLDEVPKKSRGPLHGLPIAVKDVIYTKGKPQKRYDVNEAYFGTDMPTQFNSPLYDGHFPKTDAASVQILRHAGALIFGIDPFHHSPFYKLTDQAKQRHRNSRLFISVPRLTTLMILFAPLEVPPVALGQLLLTSKSL